VLRYGNIDTSRQSHCMPGVAMHPETSLFVDDWLDEEIASLEDSVAGGTETEGEPRAERSFLWRRFRFPRRLPLDTGRYVVYVLAMTVVAATSWLIATLLSKP
jgi:hypothetical protein